MPMRDEKALRYARLLRQYCAERGCSECIFRTGYGYCTLQATKNPESWQLDEVKRGEEA